MALIHRPACSVSLSDDCNTATIRISGRSEPIIASVLGIDRGEDTTPVRIFLRSRIHAQDNGYSGWVPSGALTTILTKE